VAVPSAAVALTTVPRNSCPLCVVLLLEPHHHPSAPHPTPPTPPRRARTFSQLRDTIEKVVISFEEWKTLLQSTNTVNDPQYLHSVKQLKSGLKGAKKSLKVLDDTVTMVVKRREDFSHINDAELKSRQEFCAQCKERLESVKAVTRSQATADKLAEDAERTKLEDLASAREMASRPGGNSQFIDRQQKSQSDIISEQDDALARIDEGVQRLHQVINILFLFFVTIFV